MPLQGDGVHAAPRASLCVPSESGLSLRRRHSRGSSMTSKALPSTRSCQRSSCGWEAQGSPGRGGGRPAELLAVGPEELLREELLDLEQERGAEKSQRNGSCRGGKRRKPPRRHAVKSSADAVAELGKLLEKSGSTWQERAGACWFPWNWESPDSLLAPLHLGLTADD